MGTFAWIVLVVIVCAIAHFCGYQLGHDAGVTWMRHSGYIGAPD